MFRHSGGASLAVRLPQPHEPQRPPFGAGVSVWFGVSGAAQYHRQLTEKGADAPTPVPGPFGTMFSVRTPDGHTLTFHEVAS